ncbi:MAG: glutaminase A, partial [Aurantibacter sp.]
MESLKLVKALDEKNLGYLSPQQLLSFLGKHGILKEDLRIDKIKDLLKKLAQDELEIPHIDPGAFNKIVHKNKLIDRAIKRDFIVPDFSSFSDEFASIHKKVRKIRDGKIASYIPQLAKVNPDLWAASVCTVDGQIFSVGDFNEKFCLQSACKPVNYAIAMEGLGEQMVHQHVGKEPSGHSFNELTLNDQGIPHNPLINAGAIMCVSLFGQELAASDKFELLEKKWHELIGESPTFNNSVYLSERQTADRNYALAYFMRENKAFPDKTNITEVLDTYFQSCSIEIDTQQMAKMAASFANSGINPFTNNKVFNVHTVKNCLTLMNSCGMYDYSGEFAFHIGLPAKSGVSGVIWIVVPNVMGICLYSPLLDHHGNSAKGIAFAKEFVKKYNFHPYDSLNFESKKKKDPRRTKYHKENKTVSLISAAANGDLDEIKRLQAIGIDLNQPDYDGRTALHLASAENQFDTVIYLLSAGVHHHPKDRWGGTPLEDARKAGNKEITELLSPINDKVI